MKIILLITAVLVLAGCGDDEVAARQVETLHAMNMEMPLEERVALCDGYGFDPDFTYSAWKQRWEDIFELEPPDREAFDGWIQRDACIDSEFVGGKDE